MANQYVNKVVIHNNTIIDLTGDTAVASDVAQGKTFHDATGALVVGTASGGGGGVPRLDTPITVMDKVLKSYSWEQDPNAEAYVLYKDNVEISHSAVSPVPVTSSGAYQVKALGNGDSQANSLKSTPSRIDFYNVTVTGEHTKIDEQDTKTYQLVSDTQGTVFVICTLRAIAGYALPESLTITNVSFTYTKDTASTGTLKLWDPIAEASISVVGVEKSGDYDVEQVDDKLFINNAPASLTSGQLTIE